MMLYVLDELLCPIKNGKQFTLFSIMYKSVSNLMPLIETSFPKLLDRDELNSHGKMFLLILV